MSNTNEGLENEVNQDINHVSISSCRTIETMNSASTRNNSYPSSDGSSIVSQNVEQKSIVRDRDGINLYLRLGAVGKFDK